MTDFFTARELVYILRLVVSCICGILIGLERRNRSKEAGIRTHCVVACGAALMMIISKYGFADVGAGDGARIAAQVVSGIGFLGAGMIYVHKNTVTGLTTAAGIWATSGIGLAIGSGMYIVGVAATLIILLFQILLHINSKSIRVLRKRLEISGVSESDYLDALTDALTKRGIIYHDVEIVKSSKNGRTYSMIIDIPGNMNEDDIVELIGYDCTLRSI